MSSNPLAQLHDYGQSVWYDNIQRVMIQSGELNQLIADGVRGMTSNPTIFMKAITNGQEYLDDIASLSAGGKSALGIYESLAIADVGAAADVLRPLYDQSEGQDGYVSIEVSPRLAHDTSGTIEEARRLYAELGRPNIMIKVPATPAGLPAITTLIGEGININVTLLFSVEMYRQVAEAYIDGLEMLVACGGDPARVASVASFFVSRVDSLADKILQETGAAPALQGKLAVANAKVAYKAYQEIFGSARFQKLAAKGARVQRVLWASTSAKNPNYRDVIYVEELIGPDTVNTMPPATIDAFKDHGRLRNSLEEDVTGAEQVMVDVEAAGLNVDAITAQLLDEGLASFAGSFDELLAAIEDKVKGTA